MFLGAVLIEGWGFIFWDGGKSTFDEGESMNVLSNDSAISSWKGSSNRGEWAEIVGWIGEVVVAYFYKKFPKNGLKEAI